MLLQNKSDREEIAAKAKGAGWQEAEDLLVFPWTNAKCCGFGKRHVSWQQHWQT
jgi:hypothetical protein